MASAVPAPAPDQTAAAVTAKSVALTPAPAPAPAVARAMTSEDVQAEEDRLSAWQMNNDPQSLSNILADLNSPDKDVRMAAIEATKQFGDTNAIPVLKAAVKNTDDSEEQMALIGAANFLSIPQGDLTTSGNATQPTPEQDQAVQRSRAEAATRQQAAAQIQTLRAQGQQNQGQQGQSPQGSPQGQAGQNQGPSSQPGQGQP